MSEYVCEFGVPGNGLPVLHERVTRCEACEYYEYSSGELFVEEDDFCSHGEPRVVSGNGD